MFTDELEMFEIVSEDDVLSHARRKQARGMLPHWPLDRLKHLRLIGQVAIGLSGRTITARGRASMARLLKGKRFMAVASFRRS